jgi:hypothetical protein
MWLAIILACADPTVFSCSVMVNGNIFPTEQECIDDVVAYSRVLREQGMFAMPSCYKVKTGVDT